MFRAVRLLGLNLSGHPRACSPRICRAHAARAPSGTEHPPRTSAPRPCAEGGRARPPVLAAPFVDAAWWQQHSAARADLACQRAPTRAPKALGSVRRRRSARRDWGSATAGGGAWPPTSRPWPTAVAILPSPRRIAVALVSTKPPRAGARGACGSECRSAGSSGLRLRCQYLRDNCIPNRIGAAAS